MFPGLQPNDLYDHKYTWDYWISQNHIIILIIRVFFILPRLHRHLNSKVWSIYSYIYFGFIILLF